MHGLAHHRGPADKLRVSRVLHRYTLIIARRNGAVYRSLTGVAECVSLEARRVHPTRRPIEPLTGEMRMALLTFLNIWLSALRTGLQSVVSTTICLSPDAQSTRCHSLRYLMYLSRPSAVCHRQHCSSCRSMLPPALFADLQGSGFIQRLPRRALHHPSRTEREWRAGWGPED